MVSRVVVSDDASPATSDGILRMCEARAHQVVRHQRNSGIARSLNVGFAEALRVGATWLLTVDQDTVIPVAYVDALLEPLTSVLDIRAGALGAEVIVDGVTELRYPTAMCGPLLSTAEVFQTGTLWSVEALCAIGGFDESLGVDAVDSAACLRLRQRGFSVLVAPGTSLSHSYGESQPVRLFGRTVMATHHSPERRTSMVRNRLRLLPAEFRESPAQGWRSLRRLAVNTGLAVTVEDDRWAKAKGSVRGLLPRRDR
jgi:rhamnosyltransferase